MMAFQCPPGVLDLSKKTPEHHHHRFQQQQLLMEEYMHKKMMSSPFEEHHQLMSMDTCSEAGSEGSGSLPLYLPTRVDGKPARPFKAYPKDPMSFAAGFSSVDVLLDTQSAEKYAAFRKMMLEQICAANGGQATVSNPKMRRTVNTNNNVYADEGQQDHQDLHQNLAKDDSYTERRKKNNEAAKKSRDRRRIKEDEIAIRAAYLERENIELKCELAAARKQLASFGIAATPQHC